MIRYLFFIFFGVANTATNPISLTDAVIVCDGNSITQGGFGGTYTYPQLLSQQTGFETATFYNFGVGGQQTSQMTADAATQIDPLISGSAENILIAWEVGNDIYYNGDATAAYNRFRDYCLARQAAGWRVIVLTCPARTQTTPFGDNPSQYETKLQAANTLLLANWETFADGIVDLRSFTPLQTTSAPYYNADQAHLTQTGYEVFVPSLADVIKALEN